MAQSIALRFADLPPHDGLFAIRKRTEEIRQSETSLRLRHVAGHDFEKIKSTLGVDSAQAQYHFTGPAGFTEHAKTLLLSDAAQPDQLFYETYGPM